MSNNNNNNNNSNFLEFNTEKLQGIFKRLGNIKGASVQVDPFVKSIVINNIKSFEDKYQIILFDTITNSSLEKQSLFQCYYNDFKSIINTDCNTFKTDNKGKIYQFFNNDVLLNQVEAPLVVNCNYNLIDLGELREKIDLKIDNKKEFLNLLKTVSKDESKPVFTGVNLIIDSGILYITTCDYFSLHQLKFNVDTNIKCFNETIPVDALVNILKFIDKNTNSIEMYIHTKGIKFLINDVAILCPFFTQDFLKVEQFFRGNSNYILKCDKKTLLNYLKKCKEFQKINKSNKVIVFDFANKEVFLTQFKKDGAITELNKNNIFDIFKNDDDIPNFAIAFDIKLLENFLNCIKDNILNLEFETRLSSLQCSTEVFKGLVLPMNIQKK